MTALRSLLAGAFLVVAAAAPASPAKPVERVEAGYDLFRTPDGSRLGVTLPGIAEQSLMTFRGVPLGSFGFGDLGRHDTGPADTVVRRLDAATPSSPRVRIELVGLLLESTNVPGYFVTPQSARPGGLPSTGTLDLSFDGVGGLLRSELLVNYDVRYGAPDGPIVATGSTGLGFVADEVVWRRTLPDDDGAGTYCFSVPHSFCVDTVVCHDSGGPLGHEHCVGATDVPLITGVNHRLNGRNTAGDFHPVGVAIDGS